MNYTINNLGAKRRYERHGRRVTGVLVNSLAHGDRSTSSKHERLENSLAAMGLFG